MNKNPNLLKQLKSVIDPELHENIVDLGLIYGVDLAKDTVLVTMTLTTPFCPMAPQIEHDIKSALLADKNIRDVTVKLVWDPPWSSDSMSDELKDKFGLW